MNTDHMKFAAFSIFFWFYFVFCTGVLISP